MFTPGWTLACRQTDYETAVLPVVVRPPALKHESHQQEEQDYPEGSLAGAGVQSTWNEALELSVRTAGQSDVQRGFHECDPDLKPRNCR